MSNPNTPYTNAELAELFTVLTSTGSRSATSDKDASMDSIPALKMLFQTLEKRDAGTRPRRHTVASMLSQKDTNTEDITMSDGETDIDESLANFSCADAKKFPFAFKHPIHKLYQKADWARTVLETIDASRNKYKPLTEQVVYTGAKGDEENEALTAKSNGAIKFKIPASPITGRARRDSVISGRKRSNSTASGGVSNSAATRSQMHGPASPYHGSTSPKYPSVHEHQEARALKKRCIGRRKSINGLQSQQDEGQGKLRRTWVYNVAVSASESSAPASFTTFPPTPSGFPTGESGESKYGALGMKNMPSTLQGIAGSKRRVSASGLGILKAPLLMPLNQVTGKDRLVTRRRATGLD